MMVREERSMKFLSGLIVGLLILPLAVFFYFRFGHPPVAVADQPFPFEKQIVHVPLHARIAREMPGAAPIAVTPENLYAGAEIYREQCAACHGVMGHNSDFAAHMYPHAPQLWVPHPWNKSVVGVSDDPAGVTYWKVANGIRLTGMPSFDKVLSPEQMWQVSLLLSKANTPLPPAVEQILHQPLDFSATPAAAAMPMPAPAKK